MKPTHTTLIRTATSAALALVASPALQADSGTWNVNASGLWSDSANWAGAIVADDSSSAANFDFNITASTTVTLDSSRTLNSLVFTDATTASNDWFLDSSGGSVLTLDGTTPQINVTNRTATVSAPIAGSTPWTKVGTGSLALAGASTFSGGVTIANGLVIASNNDALGSGPVSYASGGTALTSLRITGGVTLPNAINVSPCFGVAGNGAVQQTGTGIATVSGTVTITGGPSAGGTFVGGGTVGNELHFTGPINASTNFSQRSGRIIYSGGGSGNVSMLLTGTAIIGANDGLATSFSPNIGASASGTLELNGFNQTLAGITKGAQAATVTNTSPTTNSILTLTGTSTFAGVITNGSGGRLALAVPSGELTLSGTNTFTGDVDISGGTVVVGLTNSASGHLGSSPSPTTTSKYINFSNGGTLRNTTTFNNNVGSASNRQFIFNFGTGGGVLDVPSGTTLTIDDGNVVSGAHNAAQLQGSGNLTKTGDGTLSLGNNATNFSAFTGQILINAGTLTTGSVSTNPFGDHLAGTTIASGATLNVKGVSIGAEPITVGGAGVGGAGALVSTTGTGGAATGPITLSSATSMGGAGNLTLDGAITGSDDLTKVGAGVLYLNGSLSGFTGGLVVSEGTLFLPNGTAAASLTVNAGNLSGEFTANTLTLNGGNLAFDPVTPETATVTDLAVDSNSTIEASQIGAPGTVTALSFTNRTGVGTFSYANGANYRTAPVVNETANAVTVTFAAGKSLTWTGDNSDLWDINSSQNWTDGMASDVFFSGDSVVFPEGAANPAVTLAGNLSPLSVSVTSSTTNYTLTSSAGNLITGGASLTKTGASTLTLIGANSYGGITSVQEGTLSISNQNSLGGGLPGNSLALSGGGQLRHTGTAAINLGGNRSLAVGTGGGKISHNSGTGVTMTIPGNITGSSPLNFQTEGTADGTYTLSGDNSGFDGPIIIGSDDNGRSSVNFSSVAAIPASSSITVNHPANTTTNNKATALSFPDGTVLGAGTTINMSAFVTPENISRRSQLTFNGTVTLNSPITLSGSSIIQLNGAAASVTNLNGNISELSPGAFTESIPGSNNATFFLRGNGTATLIVNGQINLPSAGATVAVTDGATAILNSAGNICGRASVVHGTLRIGTDNALASTAELLIGQGGNQNCLFDLNGFDQTVAGIVWAATSGNTVAKGVTNSHPTEESTLTIVQETTPGNAFAGSFSGNLVLVKQGAGNLTLTSTANDYNGGTTISGGALVAGSATAFGSGPVHIDGGALDLNGQTIANEVTVHSGGSLTGAGTATINGPVAGNIAPGTGVGALSLTTATTLASTGSLSLELGGATTRGTDYDALDVGGTLVLDGTITVTLVNGFTPEAGNSFDLVDSTGALDVTDFNTATDLILPTLPGGLAWDTSAFASTGVLTVVTSDPLPAWAGTFGLTGNDALPDADPDGDGISNILEYAFGIEPNANNSAEYRGVAATDATGALSLSYRRPTSLPAGLTAASYKVQINTLGLDGSNNWTDAVLNTDYTESVSSNGGVDTITINFTGAVSGRKFARIAVVY